MSARVSMRKIAEVAGVSVATVSQILGNRPMNFCSEETRLKVRKIAEELGYRQNIGYKLMHSLPTRTAGVLIASPQTIQEEHWKTLCLQVLNEFALRDYAAFCHILPTDDQGALEKVQEFISRGVEHFVFIGLPFGLYKVFAEIEKAGVTAIFNIRNDYRYIATDGKAGMEQILLMLQKKCGENFKLITQYPGMLPNSRVEALCKVFSQYEREEIISKVIVPLDLSEEGNYFENAYEAGYRETARLLKENPTLQGLSFMNDYLALGAVSYIMESGNPDYQKLIITGFNNTQALIHHPFPVSTVRHDLDKLSELLVDYAINSEPCKILVPPIPELRFHKNSKED